MGEERESDTVFWFGKHEGKELGDAPSGYLRWMVDNFDPVPLPKDTRGMTVEEIRAMEERMRTFLSAAEDELINRDQT